MVNILPGEVKEQVDYSKKNVVLRRYLLLAISAALLLSATIGGAYWYSNKQITALQNTLASKQQQRATFKDTEVKIQALQSNLGLIEKLLNQKTRFSVLLDDLAAVLPSGTYINTIELTGDDKKPVQLLITANSLTQAGLVRDALLKSNRISTADIQSITQVKDSSDYTVDLIVAFKEGQAR